MKKPAAIILDGDQRSALAAARSLGSEGVEVVVGASKLRSLASSSKYCRDAFSYRPPDSDPGGFLSDVLEAAARREGSVLFPMTDMTLNEILLNRGLFAGTARIPFPDYALYDALSDKESLFRQARGLGLPMPETLFTSDYMDRAKLCSEASLLGFPLVVKASHSRARAGESYVSSSVAYVENSLELEAILGKAPYAGMRCLVQEKIRGPGIGVFLLARHGEVLARFAHCRIREKPPSGGVSVLCESIEPPARAMETASMLISANAWHGVAMVEFKWDEREARPKLIEVNGRFWGSLNLAIRAGVNFPFLLYRMALGFPAAGPEGYRIGVKSRWELGDLDHLLIRLMKDRDDPAVSGVRGNRLGAVASFMTDFFRPSVSHEVFRFGDPRPFFHEVGDYLRRIAHHG